MLHDVVRTVGVPSEPASINATTVSPSTENDFSPFDFRNETNFSSEFPQHSSPLSSRCNSASNPLLSSLSLTDAKTSDSTGIGWPQQKAFQSDPSFESDTEREMKTVVKEWAVLKKVRCPFSSAIEDQVLHVTGMPANDVVRNSSDFVVPCV